MMSSRVGPQAAPLVRVKTSEAVAEHIIDLLFAGILRSGDRIDLDAIAGSLGVSRAPVREALLHLERDGLVTLVYHRGAYVADFGPASVEETFDLYALLSATAASRAATGRDPATVARLEEAFAAVRAVTDTAGFESAARQFRRVVNLSVAGPHLRALLRSFGGLVPAGSRLVLAVTMDAGRRYMGEELQAIRDGDSDAAAAAVNDHIHLLGREVVAALRRDGVFRHARGEGA